MTEFKRLRTVNVGEHVEELEDSSIAGGSRGHHNHLGKQVGSILFCFIFNNIKHSSILRISKSTPRNFLKCKENPCPWEDLYRKNHCSFIHYCPKGETCPKLASGRPDTQSVDHSSSTDTLNGREWTAGTCSNRDDSQNHAQQRS